MIVQDGTTDAFDDLASMFLGGAGETPPEHLNAAATEQLAAIDTSSKSAHAGSFFSPSPREGAGGGLPNVNEQTTNSVYPTHHVTVEGLILGHLPMLASLWATPYARMAAERDNSPVALIRLDHGSCRVEIFGSHEEPESSTDLTSALRRAASLAPRVVMFPNSTADETLLASQPRVDSLVVLTGADDASAVGAYKAIKRLAGENARRPIRVAVMGADDEKAAAMLARLTGSVKEFLGVTLEHAGNVRQITGGSPGTVLFEGPSAATLQSLTAMIERTAPLVGPSTPSVGRASPPAIDLPSTHEAGGDARTTINTPPTGSPVPTMHTTNGHITSTITGPAIASRLPMGEPAPKPQPTSGMMLAGLSPLSIKCPFDHGAILATDADGTPQVVISAVRGSVPEATHRLVSVGAWMHANRELLSMLLHGKLNTDTKPTLHLLTDKPADARRLLDSDLRVHIVVEPSQLTTGPVCLALN